MPGELVELLEIGVGEGQDLGEKGVEAGVVGELAEKVSRFFVDQLGEALAGGFEGGVDPVLGCLRTEEVCPCEGLDVGGREHSEVEQPSLDLVQQVGVGLFGEEGGFVVRLEGLLDLIGLVCEVEDHRAVLGGVGAVQARQRLDRVHAAELLVDVHGVEQRLVEARLELVGDHQEAVLGLVERGGRLPLADHPILSGRVHAGLRVGLAAVLDRSGEGDERLPGVALFLQVAIQSELAAHRVQARARDDHRLGAAADLMRDQLGEVLHADGDLLADGMRVELDEGLEEMLRLPFVVPAGRLRSSSSGASTPCRWCRCRARRE